MHSYEANARDEADHDIVGPMQATKQDLRAFQLGKEPAYRIHDKTHYSSCL